MISFDPFPVLETPSLRLRAIGPDDVEAIFRIQSDPEVTRYFGRAADSTIAEAEKRVTTFMEGVRDQTSIRWGITLRGDDALIGSSGFWRWNKLHRWAEIGYELSPAHWGRGVMPEALSAILRFGFASMDLHRVEGHVDPDNRASRRVLEKLGFTQEAILRENWFHQGRFTDSVIYGLLDRDRELERAP